MKVIPKMIEKYVSKCNLDTEKVKEIVSKLEIWRNVRHIETESQKPSLLANVLEELTELERGKLSKNIHEMIDAYCDVVVFTLNACDISKAINTECDDKQDVCLYKFEIDDNNDYLYSIKLISQLCMVVEEFRTEGKECRYREAYKLVALCFSLINSLGYDPYGCLNETINEISSRTGTWDEKIKKFVKDTSDEAKARWYKANYDLCKKGE